MSNVSKPHIIKLDPCPWCGRGPKMRHDINHVKYEGEGSKRYYIHTVYCSNEECEMRPSTPEYTDRDACAEAWNTRHQPEPDHAD